MKEFDRILFVLTWAVSLAAFAGVVWAVYHWDLFPRKRLRNILFSEVKIGQTFFDYGGEELALREYVKASELDAKCMNVPNHPLVDFQKTDVVKIEVLWIGKRK